MHIKLLFGAFGAFFLDTFFCAGSRFGRILSWDLWGFGFQLHGRDPQATCSGSPKKTNKHTSPRRSVFWTSKSIRWKGEFLRCFWWAVELLVANTWRAWHWWVSQPCWQLVRHWTTGKNWAWKVALLNEKSCVFIVFDAPRGDSLDTDARCMQWPWWKVDCHRHGSHRGFLMSMLCFASCQSECFFLRKLCTCCLLLWSFFQVCYFYFLTIRLQASSFPHTPLLITGIRYWYISGFSIHNMKIESVTTLRISDSYR